MTDEAKLIVNILRECAVATQCSKCVVFCENNECLFTAAAKMIESLSAELEQVKRERDAAVEDLNASRMCRTCAHYGDDGFISKRCINCASHCLWQWRGVKEG